MKIIFREVVKSDEFLSLSSEDVVKIISCNDLAVPYEEKVSKQQLVIWIWIFCMENQLKEGGQVGIALGVLRYRQG